MGWQWSVTSGPSPCLQASSMSVGLQGDSSLQVEISDAVSEWSGTRSFFKLAELFEQLRELEGQVASNKDLKLLDMLRYYMRDSQAAKLLALADYKNANKVLDKACTSNQPGKSSWTSNPMSSFRENLKHKASTLLLRSTPVILKGEP
ncbi:hypothetical protein CapIbe_022397 [Capra ibex]